MVMKKLLILLITSSLLFSCATKKVTTNKTIVEQTTDTVMIEKIREVIKPVKETIYIENPCDSLGNLKDFERVVQSQHGKITIKNEGGKIKADINLDSIVAGIEREYKSKMQSKSETTEKVVVKEKKPLWVYLLIVYSVMITALYIKKLFS
jgi:hypothetical protein